MPWFHVSETIVAPSRGSLIHQMTTAAIPAKRTALHHAARGHARGAPYHAASATIVSTVAACNTTITTSAEEKSSVRPGSAAVVARLAANGITGAVLIPRSPGSARHQRHRIPTVCGSAPTTTSATKFKPLRTLLANAGVLTRAQILEHARDHTFVANASVLEP